MESTTIEHAIRHRPGGRTARTTERINSAVFDVLIGEGLEACTLARIADVTGLQRSTLYRRYADRWEMIVQAYLARAAKEVAVEPTGDFLSDFRMLLSGFVENFSGPIGQAMMAMVFAIRGTSAEVHIDRFLEIRLAQFEPIFLAAIEAGNISERIDRREVLERSMGAAIFRLFVEGLPVDEAWVDRMADDIAKFYCRPAQQVGKETAS